jgi:lipopolysaccharide/colanic/teichoic acid biosynthesis glycosyltransferase
VTRVGRFLRRTRIDEVPQFLNVILGDMSVVGPRPERPFFMATHDRDVPDFKRRLRAKPGITGLAQINAGYTNTVAGMKRKLGFDLEYIRRMSPVTDLRILLQTVLVVVTGKGAF